jgi:hypothetical protein
MNKLKLLLIGCIAMPLSLFAGDVVGTFQGSNSGTTSATVFVPPERAFAQVTDLSWKLDAGTSTGLVVFRPGDVRYASTSATSGSGTTVWFANTGTAVTAGEYIIIFDESAGSYLLRQVNGATTTSVTVTESISVGLTTSDQVWSVTGSFARPVSQSTSGTSAMSVWLPENKPVAITVDGNTTACRISTFGTYMR